MNQNTVTGWTLFTLLASSLVINVIAYPQATSNLAAQYRPPQLPQQKPLNGPSEYVPSARYEEGDRKFAEKPNALKKVALDDIDDDIQTNQITDNGGGGFSWTNMLGTLMTMFFNNAANIQPTKSDDLETNGGLATSPWANVISIGLRIFTTLLGGGGATNDGIDKVDNGGGGSPMQFINIVVNLLDALKTSFSHRSLAARSIGKKDSVSDAAVASIAMMKSYVRTYRNADDKCMQRYLCEANMECNKDIGGSSIFCQLGTYATSFVLERTTGNSFEAFYDAGRRGRSGENCRQIYLECNEV
ncbi:uncharacterized protein LOC119072786 isoform X2 [Bradysia coprophila]|uniref:uncharacterized protein LOC119072786 isoform X2 n=1 Tax=Bradysia coprophila TaxID=38358 RepID=UPI00187DA934|nr:uncharacterized protein LOC119072786 isoform X2 [Bradysia coprophila]